MGGALTPIEQLGAAQMRAIHTVITDIDDTVSTDGMLTASAYSSLEKLWHSGLRVIVTTGRPAGWCDHIARMWPVDAVVGENGACCYWYDRPGRRLSVRHSLPPKALRANRDSIWWPSGPATSVVTALGGRPISACYPCCGAGISFAAVRGSNPLQAGMRVHRGTRSCGAAAAAA